MRAFVALRRDPSLALARVAAALARYAPAGVEVVDDPQAADLVVLHVVGRWHRVCADVTRLQADGKRYAVIQYGLRRTQRPSTHDWRPIWDRAVVVWSYYNLAAAIREDGGASMTNVYYAPLGVDPAVFQYYYSPPFPPRRYMIMTSGRSYLTEGVREAVAAARRVQRPVFHLGPELNLGPDVVCGVGIVDATLARRYSECEFVSGLRRVEGFELPAAEGLLCGARPILFEREHYRRWYGDLAVYIPEASREQAIESLEAVFRQGARPVTSRELYEARQQFDWRTIISGFWERVLEHA